MADGTGFGFAVPDYALRAQAGMPLDPGAPDQTPMPRPAPATTAPPAQEPYKPGFLDILQGVIFDGQSPAEAAQAARGRAYTAQQQQMMMETLRSVDPQTRMAMMLNPAELGKAIADRKATHALKAGEVGVNMGADGGNITAPVIGLDPLSGKGYSVGAGGNLSTGGAQLPGAFKAGDGIISSARDGSVSARYSMPQVVPAGSGKGDFTPDVAGPSGFPALPGGPAGAKPSTTSPSQASAPRGIRNLNFGNVRPLPHGQAWAGQTGVDKDGYAVFSDPAAGIAAASKNLQSYASQGINTPAAIAARWAPAGDGANDPKAYATYLAGRLGVKPTDQIDLSDPKVQQQVLRGVFDFENGPQAMASWRGQKPSAQVPTGVPTGGGWRGGEPRQPTIVPPGDPAYANLPKGTVLQRAPTGELSVLQKPEYDPASKNSMRDKVLGSQEYTQANASQAAYKAMMANSGTMTGPSAYAMLDTFARAINPGAVARPQVIETIEKSLGPLNGIPGQWDRVLGQGNLTPQVRQQVIDAVVPFAQAHWDQANMLNSANAALAKQHGFDAADVTAPLEGRPERLSLTVPPAGQRSPGLYMTPKGPLHWTGQGWHQ
jgi:hypothetical protein